MKLSNPVLFACSLVLIPTVFAGFWDGIIETKKTDEEVAASDLKAKLGNVPAVNKHSAPAPAAKTSQSSDSYGVDVVRAAIHSFLCHADQY